MFLDFLSCIAILWLGFQIVFILFMLGPGIVTACVKQPTGTLKSLAWSSQLLLAVGFSTLLSLATNVFRHSPNAAHPLLYTVVGFVATLFLLADHAQGMGERATGPDSQGEISEYVADAASYCVLIGAANFIICLFWPRLWSFASPITIIIDWTIWLASWLGQFWIVQGFVGITAFWYVVEAGLVALVGIGSAVMLVWSKLSHDPTNKQDDHREDEDDGEPEPPAMPVRVWQPEDSGLPVPYMGDEPMTRERYVNLMERHLRKLIKEDPKEAAEELKAQGGHMMDVWVFGEPDDWAAMIMDTDEMQIILNEMDFESGNILEVDEDDVPNFCQIVSSI